MKMRERNREETLERVIMERARNTGETKFEQKTKSFPRKK